MIFTICYVMFGFMFIAGEIILQYFVDGFRESALRNVTSAMVGISLLGLPGTLLIHILTLL